MFFIFFVKKGKADYNFVDTVLNLGRVLFLDTVSFLGRVLNFSINNQDKYEGAFLAERRVLATFQSGAPRFAFYDQGFCLLVSGEEREIYTFAKCTNPQYLR